MPLATDALPDHGAYVAAAFLVFFGLAIVYFAIMSVKLSRLERELVELNELADRNLGDRLQAPAAVSAETKATAPTDASADQPDLDPSLMP